MIFLASGFDLGDANSQIMVASLIIVLSYLFNKFSEKTNVPAVLLLILLGILMKLALDATHIDLPADSLQNALKVLGTVGVIMIVMEAALDLEFNEEKFPLIGKAILIALLSLIFSIGGIALVLLQFFEMSLTEALIHGTPLAIMSSAIIIPSIGKLPKIKQEFMVYESAFSDILGIMVFYFLLNMNEEGIQTASINFGVSLIITLVIAIVASYLLIFIFKDLKGHIRLFLLIAILLLLYSSGKVFLHLYGALLIILFFGLALANHERFFKIFKKENRPKQERDPIEVIEKEFHLITLETAFVVRTFFFVVFGLSISLTSCININVFVISIAVLIVLYFVRIVFLRLCYGKNLIPELFIAPRGLITVLLFYQLPIEIKHPGFDEGILMYVILISSLIMTGSLIYESNKSVAAEADAGIPKSENHEDHSDPH
jgi:Kef-type K+ transport system membrane component KefB